MVDSMYCARRGNQTRIFLKWEQNRSLMPVIQSSPGVGRFGAVEEPQGEARLNRCCKHLSFDSKRWSVLCITDTGLSPLAGSPGAVVAMLVPGTGGK
ncbi:unnamed protein product [Boreogadus saida]